MLVDALSDNIGQVNHAGTGGSRLFTYPQQIPTADQLVHAAHANLGHDFAKLFSNVEHEVHHVFRLALEPLPQFRILGGNAYRAAVQVAHTHHHAAHAHQRRRGKAEFLCTQHTGNGHIPAAHQLAVHFQCNPGAEAVQGQGLMGFRNAQLPGQTGIMDGAAGGSTCAAVTAGDQNDLRPCLGHACRHRTHACFADQLHADAGTAVGTLQVINQLR